MTITLSFLMRRLAGVVLASILVSGAARAADDAWVGDLTPITSAEWNEARAAHLLERAGFGATPEEAKRFAAMPPKLAVESLVRPPKQGKGGAPMPTFEHSGIHDPGLDPFPASRPATTDMARDRG